MRAQSNTRPTDEKFLLKRDSLLVSVNTTYCSSFIPALIGCVKWSHGALNPIVESYV
jgi:hypothetical protein